MMKMEFSFDKFYFYHFLTLIIFCKSHVGKTYKNYTPHLRL